MKVVRAVRFGGPEVLAAATAADPAAGPGQAVVQVAAADVLFFDATIRQGLATDFVPLRPPYVPGNGVAGQVGSVGAGVDPRWIGRRVVAHTGKMGGGGGYAEQALVPAEALVAIPAGLGLGEAAALLHDGATALGLAGNAGIWPGEWVLVVGAGGLGLLLVQLARAAGAHVIAAARGRRKLDLALKLGADAVVDYSEPGWPQKALAATAGTRPSVVFDGAGTHLGQAAFTITADGGRFSAHGSPSGGFAQIDPQEARRRGITVRGIEQAQYAPARLHALTTRVLAEAATGQIQPVIGQTFPLEQAAKAHAAIESRSVTGKTLLLTRFNEADEAGLPARDATAAGVQRTGAIVTAAAVLLAVALGAFVTARVVFLQELGLGAAAAVLIDAFVVRALLVPAVMAALGGAAWWSPRPLARLHRRLHIRDTPPPAPPRIPAPTARTHA